MPYGRSRLTASAQIGDPFLGGVIKKLGGVAGRLFGLTPAGAAAGTVVGAILGRKSRSPIARVQQAPMVRQGGRVEINPPMGGAPGVGIRVGPVGTTGQFQPAKKKRRRMNPTNIKALRRAVRREEAFIRAAKKTGLVAVPKAKRVRRAARPKRRN